MFKRILLFAAAAAVFLAGSYAEGKFQITPVVNALFRTGKMMLGDLYTLALARLPGEIDTTSAFVALGGLAALVSFKYLIRSRRL
ncbi:MAG: hypothetical protein M1489_06280 [Firmicutes bacterium]|nr:hypothetical protein [Bacillota bacterium]